MLYLPEDYDPQKEYPVLVQFYETHSGELNIYHAPLLSSALGDPMYFASNGYRAIAGLAIKHHIW